MNFLAHLLIADPDPASRLGAVLPDLMRVRRLDGMSPALARAVVQHRRVDRATDSHPAFLRCRHALADRLGRYGAVCLDVFFDHALSLDWPRFTDTGRADFIASIYRDIHALGDLAPEPVRPALQRLVAQDWLSAYATLDGIALTLARMSARLSQRFDRPVDLAPLASVLADELPLVRECFAQVFSDILRAERAIA